MTTNRRGGARRVAGGAPSAARRRAALGALAVGDDALHWTEKQFQEAVVREIRRRDVELQARYPGVPGMRFLVFHAYNMRRSLPGWPDLTMFGPGGFACAELKAARNRTHTGQLSEAQARVLDVLLVAGVEAYEWNSADWPTGAIHRELDRLATPTERTGALLAEHNIAPPDALKRARCGCVIDEDHRISVHTCAIWGPPS
jgi:hypothetical protein